MYFNHNRDMFLSSAISLTIFSIVFFSQNYQYKNIFYHFSSYYKKIENEVIFLNSKLSAIKDKYNLRDYYVFDCGGFFPYNDNNLNFFKKNKKYCKNNSVLAMKKAIFIFKKNNTDKGELELFQNINNFHMDYIQFEKFNIASQKKKDFDGFYFYFKMP